MNQSKYRCHHDAVTGIAHHRPYFLLKRWKWLWNEWLTTVDPKRIGIMYIVVALIMFLKGFADALMMRLQQAFLSAIPMVSFLPTIFKRSFLPMAQP